LELASNLFVFARGRTYNHHHSNELLLPYSLPVFFNENCEILGRELQYENSTETRQTRFIMNTRKWSTRRMANETNAHIAWC